MRKYVGVGVRRHVVGLVLDGPQHLPFLATGIPQRTQRLVAVVREYDVIKPRLAGPRHRHRYVVA